MTIRAARAMFWAVLLAGCGARTALDPLRTDGSVRDAGRDAGIDAGRDAGRDAGTDAGIDAGTDAGIDAGTDGGVDAGCRPLDDRCGDVEVCGNGANDDCDDRVDEGCGCEPGAVQGCFLGPPGRRDVGACQDGSQVCTGDAEWGRCEGGVLPDEAVCTGRDDLCNGCSAERLCPIDCPSPGDPRVPPGQPFAAYALTGRAFYTGIAVGWQWTVRGGPCDELAPRLRSYELEGARSENATLTPRLSGDYRVTLAVTRPDGSVIECSWVVNVAGPGLRVEMCYPESETDDLDLFLHRPDDTAEWYVRGGTAFMPIPEAACGWDNCEATIRLETHPVTGGPVSRADWGYADTDLAGCVNGPLGDQWAARGTCANPRLDIDNNLSEGIGVPENINVDNPRDGQTFRVMVQNFTGEPTRPVVNVYCGGRRVATYGQAPDALRRFAGRTGDVSVGAMWRVADVTTRVDAASGETVGCDVEPLHPPGRTTGYDVTNDDPRY